MSNKITKIQIEPGVDATKRVRQIAAEFGPEAPSHYLAIPVGILILDLKRIAISSGCVIKSWIHLDGMAYAEILYPPLREEDVVQIIVPLETQAVVFAFKWLADKQLLKKGI